MLFAALGAAFQLQIAMPQPGTVALPGTWRFRIGDAAVWARPDLDDRVWDTAQVGVSWTRTHPGYRGFAWYRAPYVVPGRVDGALALSISSAVGAYEVYLDGRLLGRIGGFPPGYRARSRVPFLVQLPSAGESPGTHVVAIRAYSEERLGGIVGQVEVGPWPALQARQNWADFYLLGTALLIIGIGVSQLFFWLRRPGSREQVGIFLVCLFLGLLFVVWMPAARVALEPHVHFLRLHVALGAAALAAYCYTFRRLLDSRRTASSPRSSP